MATKESEAATHKVIEPIYGSYRMKHLTVEAAVADQAIADGWAFDPYAKPPKNAPDPNHNPDTASEAAIKYERELAGLPPLEESGESGEGGGSPSQQPARMPLTKQPAAKPDPDDEDDEAEAKRRQSEADRGSGGGGAYQTRQSTAPAPVPAKPAPKK
jgi:hypothetical protein